MPEHHTWFDLLLGTFYKNVENAIAAQAGGQAIGLEGEGTWITNSHIGVQHVFASLFVLIILLVIGAMVRPKLADTEKALVPESRFTLRTFVELLVEATYGMMADMMGPKAAKFFLPLIGTCAFLILFSNALGLVPGFLPSTDVLNTTVPYAIVIFLATHIFGVKENGIAYFKHFLGPVLWLAPLMVVIEVISHLVRPLSLSIRLAANMAGDHMALSAFLGFGVASLFVVPLPIYMLGVIVVVVQTLVFCLLSTVYISLAIAHDEH